MKQSRSAERYRWVILAVATFTQAAAGFFTQGIGALGVQFQRDLDIGAGQLGLLISAAQLAPLVGLLIAGELLDRFDERWVVGTGCALVGCTLIAGTLAPGYTTLLLVLLVVGVGYSTVQPGGSKSVASWFGASRRGAAMGIRQAGLPLGAALSSATLPVIAATHGWRGGLLAGGLVALLGAVAFVTLYRRPPRPSTSPPAVSGSRSALLRIPAMRTALMCGVSLISVQYGVLLLTVLHLHEAASMSPGSAALVLVAAQTAGVAGRIVLAAVSDRDKLPRQSVVTASMLAAIAALVLLATPLGASPVTACLALIWLGFFGIGWYGPWVTLVAEAAPAGRTGFALGLAMTTNQIAIVLIPPVLGTLLDLTDGFTASWGLLAAMIALALAGPTYRRIHRRQPANTPR